MLLKQGESKKYTFFSYTQGTPTPILDAPDDIVFTAKYRAKCGETFTITKKLNDGITFDAESGKYTMKFNPEDTINLPTGNYDFDIKIKRAPEQYFIVKLGRLTIEQSYTGVI